MESYHMHHLERKQVVPTTLEKAWDFFSDPGNLSRITPPGMGFRILECSGQSMYPGMIITYRVKPLLGIPLTWVTEITHVEEGSYFVDEQRIGPYRLWHHQHHFRPVEGGVEMRDRVDYALPLGWFGRFLHFLVVKKKLEKIFEFRQTVINKVFSAAAGTFRGIS